MESSFHTLNTSIKGLHIDKGNITFGLSGIIKVAHRLSLHGYKIAHDNAYNPRIFFIRNENILVFRIDRDQTQSILLSIDPLDIGLVVTNHCIDSTVINQIQSLESEPLNHFDTWVP